MTAGLTEALGVGVGEGVAVGSGVGVSVGVGLGEGEDCSPKTSEEGKNIDFKKKPEPIRKKSKTPERIKVGREGLCNTIRALYIMCLLTIFLPISAFEYIF